MFYVKNSSLNNSIFTENVVEIRTMYVYTRAKTFNCKFFVQLMSNTFELDHATRGSVTKIDKLS